MNLDPKKVKNVFINGVEYKRVKRDWEFVWEDHKEELLKHFIFDAKDSGYYEYTSQTGVYLFFMQSDLGNDKPIEYCSEYMTGGHIVHVIGKLSLNSAMLLIEAMNNLKGLEFRTGGQVK